MPIDAELKSALDSMTGETKRIVGDLATKYTTMETQQRALQTQLDAIDAKTQHRHIEPASRSLVDVLKEDESVQRLIKDRKGTAIITLKEADALFLERKATITSAAAGYTVPGIMMSERIPGIVGEARQTLMVRDVLASRPTSMQVIDFVKVDSPMIMASPQSEGSAKLENSVTFLPASERVRTLATMIPASRQVLDDWAELAGFLDATLRYYVDLAEEIQLLAGSGTGENLNGLIPQSADFDTGLLTGSWNKIDILGRACQQVMESKELKPTFAVLHPRDWWGIRLTKDEMGRYILGDPQAPLQQSALFDLTPVVTTSINAGTFLVGTGNAAASEIRDRMETVVEISTSHSDWFAKNLIAIRAEKRLALVVKRPNSYVNGSFSSSPA